MIHDTFLKGERERERERAATPKKQGEGGAEVIQSYILAVLYIYRLSRQSLIGICIYRQECGTYIQRYPTLISRFRSNHGG